MKINFKQVASVLYEQFGDEGIAWVKEQAGEYLRNPGSKDSEDPQPEMEDDIPIDAEDRYEDGDAFSAQVKDHVHGPAADAIQSPDQVVEVVLGLVMMAGEVRKFEEAQVTKRVRIAAERDVAIANIKAQQELLQSYLDQSFDERAENFGKLFALVDNALDTNNMTALAMGLESVIKLAASSPFKDLRTIEATAAALTNPQHEWDF